MSNTPQQPRPDDAVLGGQYQAPIDGAVLGGIEGLRQRLASDNLEVKKVALTQALNYGVKGVEVLFEVLNKEKNLNIQWLAYQILEKQDNIAIKRRLNQYFPYYDFETVKVNSQGDIIEQIPCRARYLREDLGQGIYLDLTYIPSGSFWVELDEHHSKKIPYQVTLKDYYLGKYLITQEQYQVVMAFNRSHFKNNPRNPVERVSWYDAQAFCQKLKEMTRKEFRLPTEVEWEYACRAGTTTAFYCGETISTDLANYDGNFTYNKGKKGIYREQTTPVGSFPANPWGLYDMVGNVWEWCEDLKTFCIVRGGSWLRSPKNCSSASRSNYSPKDRLKHIGFRVLCENLSY